MVKIINTLVCLLFFLLLSCNLDLDSISNLPKPVSFRKIQIKNYPKTHRDTTIIEDYHGLKVADPYRWLEDDYSDNTLRWVDAQQTIVDKYFSVIPFRDKIKTRLEKLCSYERYSTPQKAGEGYCMLKNDGTQEQSVLYQLNGLEGDMKTILNPNKLSSDGSLSLGNYKFSKDGKFLAYQLSEKGSDWKKIRIKDIAANKNVEEELEWIKFSSIAWAGDGFFYSRYPAVSKEAKLSGKNKFHQLYYHKIGTEQEEDELIFADRSNPFHNFYSSTTADERFLVLSVAKSTSGNALYFKDLSKEEEYFTPIVESFKYDFTLIGNVGDALILKTNYKADNERILLVNTNSPEERFWEEVIPEASYVIQSAKLVGNKILVNYLRNASSQLVVFDKNGRELGMVKLPSIGTVKSMTADPDNNKAFIAFTSFTQPNTIYEVDLDDLSLKPFKQPAIDFDSEAYETKQVWYKSYDGKEIPMFIIHKKGLKLDGTNPTLLYGYGGFNISITPDFNRTRLHLFPMVLENNGVCAVANIRGGGEFGTEWHKAGTKENKNDVFIDFQAAAEYLIANQYTSSEKLAIYGRSNGGLLVGACVTQRPDLYKVAIPAVGVLDMLRYHKFTIGWAWATDYGRSDNPDDFDYLYEYSPLHNVTPQNYPATLVTTADHDDRVVPAHSFKFAAALQENQKSDTPILIRVDSGSGHGAGKSLSKSIEEATDVLSFMFYNLKHDVIY